MKHNRTLCQPTDDQNFIQCPNQRFYFYPKVLDICSVVSRMHIFFCLSNFILNFLFELPQFTHTESKYSISVRYIGWRTRRRGTVIQKRQDEMF